MWWQLMLVSTWLCFLSVLFSHHVALHKSLWSSRYHFWIDKIHTQNLNSKSCQIWTITCTSQSRKSLGQVVTIGEALATLVFFPILTFVAYAADVGYICASKNKVPSHLQCWYICFSDEYNFRSCGFLMTRRRYSVNILLPSSQFNFISEFKNSI